MLTLAFMAGASHRDHAWWRDYKERGIYLITVVTNDRQHLFGELNNDVRNPDVVLSDLGKAVQREWFNTIDIQHSKGRDIRALGSVVMPDHFHGILFVEQPMDVSIGEIIRCFKLACTQARNRLFPPAQPLSPSSAVSSSQPCTADLSRSSASVSSCQPCTRSSASVSSCQPCMAARCAYPLSCFVLSVILVPIELSAMMAARCTYPLSCFVLSVILVPVKLSAMYGCSLPLVLKTVAAANGFFVK